MNPAVVRQPHANLLVTLVAGQDADRAELPATLGDRNEGAVELHKRLHVACVPLSNMPRQSGVTGPEPVLTTDAYPPGGTRTLRRDLRPAGLAPGGSGRRPVPGANTGTLSLAVKQLRRESARFGAMG